MTAVPLDPSTFSARLAFLYEDVQQLAPDAMLELTVVPLADLDGTGGGKHEWEDGSLHAWVTVAEGNGEWCVAHELLHAAFRRRGFRGATLSKRRPAWVGILANVIDDAVIHPLLWRELR